MWFWFASDPLYSMQLPALMGFIQSAHTTANQKTVFLIYAVLSFKAKHVSAFEQPNAALNLSHPTPCAVSCLTLMPSLPDTSLCHSVTPKPSLSPCEPRASCVIPWLQRILYHPMNPEHPVSPCDPQNNLCHPKTSEHPMSTHNPKSSYATV